jgi:hypothetical protein
MRKTPSARSTSGGGAAADLFFALAVDFGPPSASTTQWNTPKATGLGPYRENDAMKYVLLIYGDERVWEAMSPSEMEKIYADHRAYSEAMGKAGVIVGGSELKPTATATSVKFGGAKTRTVDGPFAETKEQLAGFYLIDVPSLDEALAWAEKMPGMVEGTVEVRPLAPEV